MIGTLINEVPTIHLLLSLVQVNLYLRLDVSLLLLLIIYFVLVHRISIVDIILIVAFVCSIFYAFFFVLLFSRFVSYMAVSKIASLSADIEIACTIV